MVLLLLLVMKHTLDILKEAIIRDGATLVEHGSTNYGSKVKFKCYCGNEYTKITFSIVKNGGAYCKSCTKSRWKLKITKTMIERTGYSHAFQNPESFKKFTETVKARYGVSNISQSKDIQTKKEETCMKNYGVKNPSLSSIIHEKKQETCLKNFGTRFSMESEEVRKKSIQTNLIKYGSESPMQNAQIADKLSKISYLTKDYYTPSGKIWKIQGYEHYALDELLKTYSEDDITVDLKTIPEIWYYLESKKHRYYPDIYISSENRIIEVKSDRTFTVDYEKNIAKMNACIDLGMEFEFYIYDSKGNRLTTEDALKTKAPVRKSHLDHRVCEKT
jgi:hypothetical protein